MATRRATATPATGARARARVVSAAAPRLPGAPPAGLYGRRPEGGRGAAAGRERQSQSRGGRARAMVSPPEPEAAKEVAEATMSVEELQQATGITAGSVQVPPYLTVDNAEPSTSAGFGGLSLGAALGAAHKVAVLAGFVATDKALKAACLAAGVQFPSALIGMFVILAGMVGLAAVDEAAAERAYGAVKPGLDWVARWLPLFYVPSLVVLPLVLGSLSPAELGKITAILAAGMVSSLWVTAQLVVQIRKVTKVEAEKKEPAPPMAGFAPADFTPWVAGGAAALAAAAWAPPALAGPAATGFLVAATVLGYMTGTKLPGAVKAALHPILTCALCANAGSAVVGAVTGAGYEGGLRLYLTKGAGGVLGAGDLFMGFLGTVILSFGFRIYEQRATLKRHAPEIIGTVVLSALFSMFATAALGRALGLAPMLTRAIVPRSITVALALPIGDMLGAGAYAPVTATAVVLVGLLGANFCQRLLNAFGFKDPIVRGISTAGSAHGLGTAALAAKEPAALPFCALAYALIGISASVLASLPLVQAALIALAG